MDHFRSGEVDHFQSGRSIMYAHGEGMPADDAEAYFWASVAGVLGTGDDAAEANRLRDELAAKLSPPDLTRLRGRASTWLADFQTRHPTDP